MLMTEAAHMAAMDEADAYDEALGKAHTKLLRHGREMLAEGGQAAEMLCNEWATNLELDNVDATGRLIAELVRAGLAAGLPEAAKAQEMLAQAYAEAQCESELTERMA